MPGHRRHLQILLLVAAVCASSGASQAQTQKQKPAPAELAAPKPAQIDRNGVLVLVRSALLALDQANKTGNYTVLRDLGAPGFQVNTAARLSEIFVKQHNDNLDLSGVAVIEPQLSLLPQIEANGLMRMAGFFPSVPSQVNFELAFAPVNAQWRLIGISVSIGQMAPTAPPDSAPAPSMPPAAAHMPTPVPPTAQKQPPANGAKQAGTKPAPATKFTSDEKPAGGEQPK